MSIKLKKTMAKFARIASTKRKKHNLNDLLIYDLQIVAGVMPWYVNLTKPSMWWFPKSLSDPMVVSLAEPLRRYLEEC